MSAMPRREWRYTGLALGVVLLAGALLRAGYYVQLTDNPASYYPVQDAEYHHYWARGLATGDWTPSDGYPDPQIRSTPYFRPPGYPFFLGAVYRMLGPDIRAAIAVQMALGLLNASIVFLIVRRWIDDIAGLVAAAFMVANWIFIALEGMLLDPTLHITLLLLTFVGMLHALNAERTGLPAFLAGACLGLAALVRANTLLFAPIAIAWLVWAARSRGGTRGRAIAAALFLVLGLSAAIVPVTVRNYVKSRELVLVSSNGGLMLYMGNGESATGLTGTDSLNSLQRGKYRSPFDYPALVRNIGGEQGQALTHSDVSSFLAARAGRVIRENPGAFLRNTLRKTLLFWGPAELTHNHDLHYRRLASPILRHLPFAFPVVLSMALVGFALLRAHRAPDDDARRQREAFGLLVALFVLVYFASTVPFVFSSQYRAAVIPFLLMVSAAGLYRLALLVVRRQFLPAACAVAAVVVFAVVLSCNFADVQPSLAGWHYERAYAYERTGQGQAATREYEELLKVDPGHAWAHADLGSLLARQGKVLEASRHFEQALALQPDFPKARINLGFARHVLGDTPRGIEELRTVLKADPENTAGLNALAWILATAPDLGSRDPAEAVRLAERACEITQRASAECLDTLAAAYAAAGRHEEATRVKAEVAGLEARRARAE